MMGRPLTFSLFQLLAFLSLATTALAGQGVSRMLYATPNFSFIEKRTGETVITINDASSSIATLQASIDSARAANPTNVIVIRLLSGATYSVTTAGLQLGSHECLVASGATIKAASAAVTVPLIQISSGSSNVSVAGGLLDGNGAVINGISAPAAARVNTDKVTVQNCGLDCIMLNGNGNSTYDNEITVTRCEVSGSPAHAGISIQNSTQTVVVDNNCHNNAFGIWLSCAWATVANNSCHHNTTGIDISGGNDNVVANNTCDNNAIGIHAGASNNMLVSNSMGNNSSTGLNSNGSNNTFVDNLFTAGNAVNLTSGGSGNRVVAYKTALSASGQNYFYPPLIDDQHTNSTIVNGMGRTDLTIGSTTIASVQSQYDAARAANPNNVIVLHLNGTFTVGAQALTLSANTCILLNGTIQINASTGASAAIKGTNSPARISISGGIIDGGNLTGNNAIQLSSASMVQVDAMTLRNFGPANPRSGGSDIIHWDHGSTPYIITRCTLNGSSSRGIWFQLSGVKSVVSDTEVSNVNQDGVDCDSSTSGCVAKFNYCHDLVRYGVFFEQSASHNLALGNICNNDGRDINVYNNSATPRGDTAFNSIICNSLLGNNGLRNGSTGTNVVQSSHNFFFNNTVINASIASEQYGTENYYSQNYQAGGSLSTAGVESFFNSTSVSSNQFVQDSNSGLTVQVKNAATTNNASIVIAASAGLNNEQWALIPTDSGYFQIKNRNSGLVMAVSGASLVAGAPIIQFTFGSAKNDQWMPMSVGNGLYYFSNRLSGLCLDVPGAVGGTQLDQQPYSGAPNQQFALTLTQPAPVVPPPFTLSAAPGAQTVVAGNGTNFTISLTTNAGFSGPVSFTLSGLPATVSANFNPTALTNPGSSTLTVLTATNTPGSSYLLTITGTTGASSNFTTVLLNVTTPGSNLIWNSTSSTAWDTTATNWFNELTGNSDVFQSGKNVVFADRAGVVTNVTVASGVAVAPGATFVTADTANYAISGAGKITGTNSLVKTGAGMLTLNTANDYSGITTISGGVLATPLLANGGSASGIGAASSASANLVLDGGALQWLGSASVSVNRGFTITPNGATLDSSPPVSANLTLSGAIAYSGSGDRTLDLAGTDPNPLVPGGNVLSSVIADGSGGSTTVQKDGNNAWNLTGANTYSGGTTVNAGRLRANSSNALGTGPVTVADGAQAYLNVGGAFPNAFLISGVGVQEMGGSFGALRLGTGGCTITNTITLINNARITALGAGSTGAVLAGQITGDASLEFGNASAPTSITNSFPAAANAYVLRSAADTDQDESQTLGTKKLNDSNTRIAYVRFNLGSLLSLYSTGDISSATLRVYLVGSVPTDTLKVYGLLETNSNGVLESAWASAMTWNTQPAKTASPNDIPNSTSALPNANTTAVLGASPSFGASAGEVDIPLSLPDFQNLLAADSNQQITLLFHGTTGTSVPGWGSISNTSGYLVPTLEIIGTPSGGNSSAGVLTLANGNNNWSGDTTISHGTVKIATANAMPHGIDQGNVFLNGSSASLNSVLDLNGISTVINGLYSQGDPSRCVVSNGSASAATLVIGDNDAAGTFGGIIGNGAGVVSLTKIGQGTQALSGANTYSGPTILSNGTLLVNGSLGPGAVSVLAGARFGGTGIIAGPLTVNPGATLSPGGSLGALTVNNTVILRGATTIELSKTAATNDTLRGVTTLSYGGTLALTNLSGALAPTDSFKIFYANAYTGAFTNIVPAIPGLGLGWNLTTLATDGTLRIVSAPTAQPKITSIAFSATNLVLSGTNGVPGWPYYVLTSTNVSQPISQWSVLATNVFNSNGGFAFTTPLAPNTRQSFYILRLQ